MFATMVFAEGGPSGNCPPYVRLAILQMTSAKKFDQSAGSALSAAVRDIEKTTDAEIVIVVRRRSGSYRHADYLFGALVAFIGLLFVLFLPVSFHAFWI